MPGTDIAEAQRIVLGELPDLPHLPELPERGPGADMIGRGGAFLVELPIELYAARWRLAARPGHDLRVALDYLDRDLDTMTELAGEYTGPFKVQVPGPWTLAASISLPIGGAVLRDPGATRDLAASLAEGVRQHVASVRARLPHASVLLQVDEPSLPAVLAGRVPTESGFGTLRSVDVSLARSVLSDLVSAAGAPVVVHCCAPSVPLPLLSSAGVAGVALDLSLVSDLDALGEFLDLGLGLFAGVTGSSAAMASSARDLWRKLGFPAGSLASQVVITPPCGMVRPPVLKALRDAGRRLSEE
ncbi:methionine synthase [Dactylosporangium sp. AC04546]|uniref:methionine synthase n=1 Tax=Dactylosporangium sp. AC04546 TaxID=2862460 RepID=UPI001EE01BC9|nr:methionine synthase [Dactylosporangium sp. AC04546]WVK89497.1 methionine synthase [Dactylosporangium sp. AC04546]